MAKAKALLTEKDGRLFAYDVLDQAFRVSTQKASAYPYPLPVEEKGCQPYRRGPQWDGLQKALFRIFKEGTEAAQLGFCSILTDVAAMQGQGDRQACYTLRQIEREGLLQPFGTTAKGYRVVKEIEEVATQTRSEAMATMQARAVISIAEYNARHGLRPGAHFRRDGE